MSRTITISNEQDMLFVGYGSMMVETILAVVALIVVGAAATGGVMPQGTPFQIFSASVGNFLSMFGLPREVATCIITMCVSALVLIALPVFLKVRDAKGKCFIFR
jgi:carbon starvation protein